jgi:hypothetical protein
MGRFVNRTDAHTLVEADIEQASYAHAQALLTHAQSYD